MGDSLTWVAGSGGSAGRLRIEGALPPGFHGQQEGDVYFCPADHANAAALRTLLPWTAPVPVGLRKSFGFGDRLGLATGGHIRAVRKTGLFPVFAQQSIREMTRSGRTAQQVLDDATWAVFANNYREGFGSDADHLKTSEDVDTALAAGFTGFTLDLGEAMDNAVEHDSPEVLLAKYKRVAAADFQSDPETLEWQYVDGSQGIFYGQLAAFQRTVCKYGPALTLAKRLARQIARGMGMRVYDLEISIDETETPTTPSEHHFIVHDLINSGVRFTGLAPRFSGRFEKGVDYIGDLASFEREFAAHVHIAQRFRNYKLSIHSGSDKFSIYEALNRYAHPLVHVKTAGTSWLEALRVVAVHDPLLMSEMLAYAVERYPQDRASYHVSAETARIPHVTGTALLDDFHARQVLHVTFGTLLGRYREELYGLLEKHRETYEAFITAHFERHVRPFALDTAN